MSRIDTAKQHSIRRRSACAGELFPTLIQYLSDTEWFLKVKKGQRTSRKTKQFELEGRIQSSVESAQMHSVVAFLAWRRGNELSQDWLILFRSCFPIHLLTAGVLTWPEEIRLLVLMYQFLFLLLALLFSFRFLFILAGWKSLSLSYWIYSFTTWIEFKTDIDLGKKGLTEAK